MINITTYNTTYNPKLEAAENGLKTIKGTGIQLFLQFGNNERNEQIFKRVLDNNKNVIGEFNNIDRSGFVGKKKYKTLRRWMQAINKNTGCNVF